MEGNVVGWGSAKKGDPQLGGAGAEGGGGRRSCQPRWAAVFPVPWRAPGGFSSWFPKRSKKSVFGRTSNQRPRREQQLRKPWLESGRF